MLWFKEKSINDAMLYKQSQFLTLLKKEYWTHKKSVFLPALFVAGLYIGLLLTIVIALIKSDGEANITYNNINFFDATFLDNFSHWSSGIMYLITAIIITLVIYCGLVKSLINDDIKSRCVLFHNSYPVSMIKRIASKLVFTLSALVLSSLIIAICAMIIHGIAYLFIFQGINLFSVFAYNLLGILQAFMLVFFPATLFLSIVWLLSAIFAEKTASKSSSCILILVIISFVSSRLFGLADFFERFWLWIYKLFIPNIANSTYDDGRVLNILVYETWAEIFSGMTLLRIMFSLVFFGIGTYIIWKRDVV